MQAALVALSNVDSDDVFVEEVATGTSWWEWRVTFGGSLLGVDVPQVTINASSVSNGSSAPATEIEDTDTAGATVNEVQVVTLSDTTGGTFRLSFGGAWSAALDWDASTGDVDTAVEALSGAGTVSVSGSAGGPWTITFTGDYSGQDVAPLFTRANDLTNADLLRVIAYTFNDDGDLERVSDPDAVYDYIYDEMGRVTSVEQDITGLNPVVKFESKYNAGSRRTELQAYFDSTKDFKNTYAYDDMQRLSSLVQQTASGGNTVAPKQIEFNYNEISQYTSINRYAATSATEFVAASYYFYDDMNRMTKLVHSESTTAPTSGWGSDPLAGYQFSYDAGSRFTSINSYLDGVTDYAHDDTNQLIAADHATMSDEDYEYDPNGNRIMSGYDVDPNNQLYSDGTYNYTYDDEGNRLTRTKISNSYVTRYEWDFRNRLVKVTEEDDSNNALQVTENYYDAFNQWIRRSFDDDGDGGNPFTETFFVYESGQVVLEFDGDDDSDLSHRYAWSLLIDQAIADEQVSSLGSAGAVLWTFGDHLGTIRDLVTYNSTTDIATVANHREWDSYGNLGTQSNITYASTIGYTGRMWDITTGLQNNLHRWYDPVVGKWLSEDPIGFSAGDSNLQRYVNNESVLYADPSGLVPPVFIIPAYGDENPHPRPDPNPPVVAPIYSNHVTVLNYGTNQTAKDEIQGLLDQVSKGPWAGGLFASGRRLVSSRFFQKAREKFDGNGAGPCSSWYEWAEDNKVFGSNQHHWYVHVEHVTWDIHGSLGSVWATHHGFRVEVYDRPRDPDTGFIGYPMPRVFYIDNGWIGGGDHVLFPGDLPSHYFNEQSATLANGQRTPGPGPAPIRPARPPRAPGPYGSTGEGEYPHP